MKLKDGNYLDSTSIVHNKKILSDILDEIQNETEWIPIANDYGTLMYKIIGKICFLNGNFSGLPSVANIDLPFTLSKQQVWLLAGSSLYYTKAYINSNSSTLGIFAGTGSSSTVYHLNECFILE